MEVQMMEISKIIPYENNPRINDEAVEQVANSIHEFGFRNPIIVDKNMVIIAGHTRLKASEKLGLKLVPVLIAEDLSEDQANALRLADNKTGEIARWDKKKLDEELRNIDRLGSVRYAYDRHWFRRYLRQRLQRSHRRRIRRGAIPHR